MLTEALVTDNEREWAEAFFQDRLANMPEVTTFRVVRTSSGIDVRVAVAEPYIDSEDLVLGAIHQGRGRFPHVFIDFVIQPASSASK